jgi:hypothetical protein
VLPVTEIVEALFPGGNAAGVAVKNEKLADVARVPAEFFDSTA